MDGWIKPMIWNRGERVDRDKKKKGRRGKIQFHRETEWIGGGGCS